MPHIYTPSAVQLALPMKLIPAGPVALGSSRFADAPPKVIHVSKFLMGETAVTEDQYRQVIGKQGNAKAEGNCPATCVSHDDAVAFIQRLGIPNSGLPSEAEWEKAARGPARNLLEVMEADGIPTPGERADRLDDYLGGRFENAVTELQVGAEIVTDRKQLEQIVRQNRVLYVWNVYGTPSGTLNDDEAWQSVNEQKEGPAAADWGPANGYGLQGMTGGVWEWVGDWYQEAYYRTSPNQDPMGPKEGRARGLRGGSWNDSLPDDLRAAFRNYSHPDYRNYGLGFRVASAVPQDSR